MYSINIARLTPMFEWGSIQLPLTRTPIFFPYFQFVEMPQHSNNLSPIHSVPLSNVAKIMMAHPSSTTPGGDDTAGVINEEEMMLYDDVAHTTEKTPCRYAAITGNLIGNASILAMVSAVSALALKVLGYIIIGGTAAQFIPISGLALAGIAAGGIFGIVIAYSFDE